MGCSRLGVSAGGGLIVLQGNKMTAAQTAEKHPFESQRWVRWSNALFFCVLLAVVVLSIVLAQKAQFAGSPDSLNNLDTARNIVTGKGFVSSMVQQLFVPQTLPNPEGIRTPGVPYLLAGCFRLFGISLAVVVLLDAAAVVLTALCLRAAARFVAGDMVGNLTGMLWLLSDSYQMGSAWNNGFLVLAIACLLLIGEAQRNGRLSLRIAALAYGVTGGVGYLFKPTFVLSVVPFALFMLWLNGPEPSRNRKQTAAVVGIFFAVLALVSSPYWVRSLVLSGKPLYSLMPLLRLSERYDGLPGKTFHTVRFGKPLSYREMIEIHGPVNLIKREISIWASTCGGVIWLAPGILLLVVLGAAMQVGRRNWRDYAAPLLLLAEPLFSCGIYLRCEQRYLWPVFPVLIYLLAVVVRDFRISRRDELSPGWAGRMQSMSGLILILSFLWGTTQATRNWRGAFIHGARLPPSWIPAVRQTPENAIVLTDNPWAVAWYGERKAVVCPVINRGDLLQVVRIYLPTYYLSTGYLNDYFPVERRVVAFSSADLELLASGEHEKTPWALFKINKEQLLQGTP